MNAAEIREYYWREGYRPGVQDLAGWLWNRRRRNLKLDKTPTWSALLRQAGNNGNRELTVFEYLNRAKKMMDTDGLSTLIG